MSSVEVTGVTKSFGSNRVLRGVELGVDHGEVLAVLGPSGCGKTTLLRVLAGFTAPDAGSVSFDGSPVVDGDRAVPPWERRIGYVPQEGALFPHLDVRGNVLFGLPRKERTRARLAELLELAELPGDVASAYPRELSGGQQQRVALARALAPSPRVVLLDEPFSSLDAALRVSAGREVTRVLRNAGTTALLVTHDQGEALSLADRVAVMVDGVIGQVDDPRSVYAEPATLRVGGFVGEANLLPGVLTERGAECALGAIPVRRVVGAAPGDLVSVLVRPEQVRLAAPGEAPVAVVDEVTFHGPHATVRLALPDGSTLVARVAAEQVPGVGDRTGVSVAGGTAVFR